MKALQIIRTEITKAVIKYAEEMREMVVATLEENKKRENEHIRKGTALLGEIQGMLTDFGMTMSAEKIKEHEEKLPKFIRILLWLEASEKKIPSDANKIEAIQKEFDVSEDHAWWMVMSWEQIKTLKIGG